MVENTSFNRKLHRQVNKQLLIESFAFRVALKQVNKIGKQKLKLLLAKKQLKSKKRINNLTREGLAVF